MPALPNITIYLARPSGKDDVIRIRPHKYEENLYSVRYEDEESGHKYYFEDSWDEVAAYLAQIFAVLPLDQKPFGGVQFTLPAYPSIAIKTSQTTDQYVMMPIWSMIESVVRGWPRLMKKDEED